MWPRIFHKATSVLTGMKEVIGDKAKIIYAKGSNLDADAVFEERAGMFGKALGRDRRPAADIIAEAVNAANSLMWWWLYWVRLQR